MTTDFTICAGTVGSGIWYSRDSGERWKRAKMELPFFSKAGDLQIRTLAVSPHNPHRIYAGSEVGLYRSDDNGASWELLESPMMRMQIWSVAVDPMDTEVIFAGTKPPAIFRSSDGGKSWERLSAGIAEECPIGPPRVTNLVIDPHNHRNIWAGVELGGVFRSGDGGDTWAHLPQLGPRESSTDVHGEAFGKKARRRHAERAATGGQGERRLARSIRRPVRGPASDRGAGERQAVRRDADDDGAGDCGCIRRSLRRE